MEQQMGSTGRMAVQYWRYCRRHRARATWARRVDRAARAGGLPAARAGDPRADPGEPAVALAVGIPLGVLSAVHRDTTLDTWAGIVGRGRGGHADLLDRAARALRVLLPARRRTAAARPAGAGIAPPPRITGLSDRRQRAGTATAGRWAPPCTSSCCPRSRSASRVMAPLTRMVRGHDAGSSSRTTSRRRGRRGCPGGASIYGDALPELP